MQKVIYRDSRTGRLTTQQIAEKRPSTTEREVVRIPSKKK
jgi:hypothetical protein